MTATPTSEASTKNRRIHSIDAARGIALVAMAIYHFTWDLDFFGYVPSGVSTRGGWAIFAHLIAGSFLFLAGYSLWMAHGKSLRLASFARRIGVLVLASVAITIVSWFTTPEAIIYFGILHAIAAASIIGLLFLRVPAAITFAIGVVAALLPHFASFDVLDPRYLAWIGMAAHPPSSNDFVPLLPWIGPFLVGIAVSRWTYEWLKRQRQLPKRENLLTLIGRHSLVFYLLHQPILFGLVYAATLVVPPDLAPAYLSSCQTSCERTDEAAFA
nr:heparan-alpha-glucosaminide N-acetyltransferase [Marinicella sp. W31]MDC2876615.1 heparan-alpha-glucosaminide N-acetyltransferase [Marinicella sp. W31]